MKKLKLSLLCCLVFLMFVSCRNKYRDTPTDGTTYIAVDETLAPFIRNEIDVFESIYKTTSIIDIVCPEVDAFNLMMKDSVRMIIATRKLTKEETAYFKSEKIFPKELKIAVDGIAFIVHHSNRDTLLSTTAIRKIMLGEIKSWDQIDPDSKLGSVKMIFDNRNSSTAEYAVKTICVNRQLSNNLSAMKSNIDVINYVSKTPNAIGIVGLSFISNHTDSTSVGFLKGVKVVALSKEERASKENSFRPFQAYLATGQYPYTRDIYVIMTEPRVSLNTGFAAFIASDRGQRIILKSGILPATKPLRLIQVNDEF